MAEVSYWLPDEAEQEWAVRELRHGNSETPQIRAVTAARVRYTGTGQRELGPKQKHSTGGSKV